MVGLGTAVGSSVTAASGVSVAAGADVASGAVVAAGAEVGAWVVAGPTQAAMNRLTTSSRLEVTNNCFFIFISPRLIGGKTTSTVGDESLSMRTGAPPRVCAAQASGPSTTPPARATL